MFNKILFSPSNSWVDKILKILVLPFFSFLNLFNFKDRAGRVEFICFFAFSTFFNIINKILFNNENLLDGFPTLILFLSLILNLINILILITATSLICRRFHDLNLSGLYSLFIFMFIALSMLSSIFFNNVLLSLAFIFSYLIGIGFLMIKKGSTKANHYGQPIIFKI